MSYDYRADIKLVNEHVQQGAENFRDMLYFVLATIQQQLETVPAIADAFREDGGGSAYAFGSKAHGVDYVGQHYDDLYQEAMEALGGSSVGVSHRLMRIFLEVPGIGLVKAGFCAQLFANKVGCIDVHNIRMYDVPMTAVRYPKQALPATREKYISRYLDLCKGLGGSTALWAKWCHYVHTQRPKNWANGGDVSYFHYAVISRQYDTAEHVFFHDLDYQPKFVAVRLEATIEGEI